MPWGRLNRALSKSPSTKPSVAVADRDGRLPSRSVWTIRLWPVSAMNSRLPAASARTLPGKSSGPSAALFHLGGELERRQVELALGLVRFDELADHPVEDRVMPLAAVAAQRTGRRRRSAPASASS